MRLLTGKQVLFFLQQCKLSYKKRFNNYITIPSMLAFRRVVAEVYGTLPPSLFYSYLFFLVAYAALTLLPTPLPAVLHQYKVSATGLKLIDLTIIITLAVIWSAGFYGYSRLVRYARLIRHEKDGRHIDKLAKGVFFLVMWLPVATTVSALLNLIIRKHPDLSSAVIIADNYINLLIPLVGFIFIGYGAHGLHGIARRAQAAYNYTLSLCLTVFLTYIAVVYFHLVVSTAQRELVYHLSFWMLTLTLVGPYIFMWAIGLIAVFEIRSYMQKIEGIIYKKSLSYLAFGLGWLIIFSIVFQYLSTLTGRLNHLSIYALLAIIYALLLILSAGFVFIALGAKKLQQIEEL